VFSGDQAYEYSQLAFKDRKAWQRFREIPEWIDLKMKNGFTASQAIIKLEEKRSVPGKSCLLGTSALVKLLTTERKAAAKVCYFD